MMEDITLRYVEVGWVSVSLIPEIMKLGDTGAAHSLLLPSSKRETMTETKNLSLENRGRYLPSNVGSWLWGK